MRDEGAERAQEELRRRRDALATATEAAQAESITHDVDGGDIRVTVTGQLRIGELYLSEYALRSEDAEQRVVAAVNEALVAAQAAQAERLRSGLDPETASLLESTEGLVGSLRDGATAEVLRPREGDDD